MTRHFAPSPAELVQLEDGALYVALRRRVHGRRTEQLPPPASGPRRWWTFRQA